MIKKIFLILSIITFITILSACNTTVEVQKETIPETTIVIETIPKDKLLSKEELEKIKEFAESFAEEQKNTEEAIKKLEEQKKEISKMKDSIAELESHYFKPYKLVTFMDGSDEAVYLNNIFKTLDKYDPAMEYLNISDAIQLEELQKYSEVFKEIITELGNTTCPSVYGDQNSKIIDYADSMNSNFGIIIVDFKEQKPFDSDLDKLNSEYEELIFYYNGIVDLKNTGN